MKIHKSEKKAKVYTKRNRIARIKFMQYRSLYP